MPTKRPLQSPGKTPSWMVIAANISAIILGGTLLYIQTHLKAFEPIYA